MDKATAQTISDPAQVLSELQSAMNVEVSTKPLSKSAVPEAVPPVTGGRVEDESALFEEGMGDTSVPPLPGTIAVSLQAARVPPEKKTVRRVPASAKIAHDPDSVREWVGTVRPSDHQSLIDLDAGDELLETGSLYEDPVPQEERPSDAGSVRTELNMFRTYTEKQFDEVRKYTEAQMRSTHDLLTRIETRLTILEKKINVGGSRPVSVQLPSSHSKPPVQSTPGASTTVAAKQATTTTATFVGVTELPTYSPNKTIQVRTLNRLLKDKGLSLQPMIKAIPRKDWTLQYINSLPVYRY